MMALQRNLAWVLSVVLIIYVGYGASGRLSVERREDELE